MHGLLNRDATIQIWSPGNRPPFELITIVDEKAIVHGWGCFCISIGQYGNQHTRPTRWKIRSVLYRFRDPSTPTRAQVSQAHRNQLRTADQVIFVICEPYRAQDLTDTFWTLRQDARDRRRFIDDNPISLNDQIRAAEIIKSMSVDDDDGNSVPKPPPFLVIRIGKTVDAEWPRAAIRDANTFDCSFRTLKGIKPLQKGSTSL